MQAGESCQLFRLASNSTASSISLLIVFSSPLPLANPSYLHLLKIYWLSSLKQMLKFD
uniref:Uncharacterized protein n=1 Tax=Oryza brachyantha TaxID=4533 RepID=J3N557_ORYBR